MRAVIVAVALALTLAQHGAGLAQGFPLDVTISLDRGAYEPGAPMAFTIRVHNRSTEPVTLTFSSLQRFDVVIRREWVEVSRWSQARLFGASFAQVRWGPGETVTFTDQWIPFTVVAPAAIGAAGPQPLHPALYSVQAEIAAVGTRPVSAPGVLIIGRPVSLAPACVPVVTAYDVPVPAAAVAGTIEPAGALLAFWRIDPATNRFAGYAPARGAPTDLPTVNRRDVLIICLSAPGRILMPES